VRRACAAAAVTAACLAMPAAATPAASGHSGWSWSSPAPTGEDLRDVAFADGVGYAAGGFGTLLRSDDAGLGWRGLTAGTAEDATRVVATSGASFTVAGGCAAGASADGGLTVARVAYGGPRQACAGDVVAALAPDAATRYVVLEDGTVLASTDAGVSFARRAALPGTPAAGGAAEPAEVVATGPGTLLAIVGAALLRSADGGASWTAAGPAGQPNPLRALTVLPSGAGVAVGDAGTVLRTADGGATWSRPPGFGPVGLVDVACASPEVCLALTADSAVLRSTDGMASFSRVSPGPGTLNALAFASADRAVAVGDAGRIVVSDDAGAHWRPVGSAPVGDADGVRAGLGGHAWIWGDRGFVASTIDGGRRWTPGAVPTARPIVSASFADTLVGYALESGGGLWRTVNGGVSWRMLDPGPGAAGLTTVLALSAQRVLVAGPSQARLSADGGASFAPVASPALRAARDLAGAFRVRDGVVLSGYRSLVWSPDGVTGWTAVPRPRVNGRPVAVAAVDCVRGGACWLMSERRRLYLTTNTGRRWREVTAALPASPGAGPRVADVVAVSMHRAYVVLAADGYDPAVGGGWVLATADSGRTWQPQLVASPVLAGGAAGQGVDYLLGTGGQVFTTQAGGVAGTRSTLVLRTATPVIRRTRTVTVTGRLRPAVGRETVVVSAGALGRRTVTVGADGRFTLRYRLGATTRVVAHWGGDGVRAGAGSAVLTIRRR
jgi:photosystem II stability/assembly factor-like uncharacterized protein